MFAGKAGFSPLSKMERSVVRKLPDGSVRRVEPYHVCVNGLENAVLCRDAEDYDVMVKTLAVCAWRNKVIIITYNVVSNHSHTAVLSVRQEEAKTFGEDDPILTAVSKILEQ